MSLIEEPGPHPEPSQTAMGQVTREQNRLLDSFDRVASRAVNLLLLWNGGGAIAVLSYVGTVSEVRTDSKTLACLAAFMIGLIFVGLAVAIEFTVSSNRYDRFNDAAGDYYSQRIGWQELWERGEPPNWSRVVGFGCGYLSLLAAIAGSCIGVWAVMSRAT